MAAIVSPVAGTRCEPVDSYVFIRGSSATFKCIFLSDSLPTTVDVGSIPSAYIMYPRFLSTADSPVPQIVATLQGSLVPGQEFEYQFQWDIPVSQDPLDEYIISYSGQLGGIIQNLGDEFFTITASPGMLSLAYPTYATVDDIRQAKFNIDSFLPEIYRGKDGLSFRNKIIQQHLRNATTKLREELSLNKKRGMSENYRLFCIYYTIWSIMLAARGEDGSSVSDSNIMMWKSEWQLILAQEKRQSLFQGLPIGYMAPLRRNEVNCWNILKNLVLQSDLQRCA